MRLIRSIASMRQYCLMARARGKTIGLVPTMGALHKGHLSLISRSREENGVSLVSIFVNPAQFVRGEDLKRYPRDLKGDLGLARRAGVDAVFCPRVKEIYPRGYRTYVEVEKISGVLCGKSRPGHFRGVTTIVAKLFNIVMPDVAYFGQKDAQQAVIIRRMARDLNIPVKIEVMPIVREPDGLAMSSRNIYLNSRQRREAAILCKSLKLAKEMAASGEREAKVIISAMRRLISGIGGARIDYIDIVHPDDLNEMRVIKGRALAVLAVRIGRTRLIDNMAIKA
ncbi:MAG: pantoate--beta-alanine ligase [Candidatus Omnitrophica bacterium]|nr:pantoate--beta-alanine ligase [Candidatus Omnitrophota bacterium]